MKSLSLRNSWKTFEVHFCLSNYIIQFNHWAAWLSSDSRENVQYKHKKLTFSSVGRCRVGWMDAFLFSFQACTQKNESRAYPRRPPNLEWFKPEGKPVQRNLCKHYKTDDERERIISRERETKHVSFACVDSYSSGTREWKRVQSLPPAWVRSLWMDPVEKIIAKLEKRCRLRLRWSIVFDAVVGWLQSVPYVTFTMQSNVENYLYLVLGTGGGVVCCQVQCTSTHTQVHKKKKKSDPQILESAFTGQWSMDKIWWNKLV